MSFLTDYDPEKARKKEMERDMIFNQGAYRTSKDLEDLVSGVNYGMQLGEREYYQDPRIKELENIRREGMQGYDSATGGALRNIARGELAGQQNQYLSQLRSARSRAGVGGARGAAMEAASKENFAGKTGDMERKLMADAYQEKQKGTDKFVDFSMAQKAAKMGTGYGFGQAVSAQNAAEKSRQASNSGGTSYVCTEIHKLDKFTLGQMKELMKMRKYVGEVNSKMIEIYDVEGPKLVEMLNKKGTNWANFKPIVEDIINEWKSDKYLGAFLYVQFVKDLGVLAHAE